MAQENEQKNISFEDVWGRRESANIISGKISTPLCLGFLSVCNNEKDNARNLIHIMQAMASHRLNEELLLLLEVICDIADSIFYETCRLGTACNARCPQMTSPQKGSWR